MTFDTQLRNYELPKGNLESRVEGWLTGVDLVLKGEIQGYIIDPQDDLGTTHDNKGVLVTIDNAATVGANIINKFEGIFTGE